MGPEDDSVRIVPGRLAALRYSPLPGIGKSREGFCRLSQDAGGTAGPDLDGRVLDMGLLIGVPGSDKDRSLDIVGDDLDRGRVKIGRHDHQETDPSRNQDSTNGWWNSSQGGSGPSTPTRWNNCFTGYQNRVRCGDR